MPQDLRPLLCAEAALREGLARPWHVAEALAARIEPGGDALEAFLAALERSAALAPADAQRLRKAVRQAATPALAGMAASPLATLVPRSTGTPEPGTTAGPEALAGLRTLAQGRYADFTPAAAGGMGVVYWAIDTELSRQVAFKACAPGVGTGSLAPTPASPLGIDPGSDGLSATERERLAARFVHEARVTGSLEHPGIVPVYEVGKTPGGIPYYTMRFVRGERTLATALDEAAPGGLQARLRLLEPFLKACDTMDYAHARGVLHRDLKPQNIALGSFGEVVVLDWGLAKVRGTPGSEDSLPAPPAPLGATLPGVGTPGYMAPEAATGDPARVGEAADVFSLGAILFEILAGRPAFPPRPGSAPPEPPLASSVDPGVPAELARLCHRALARDPAHRPARPGELADGVRAWQASTAAAREQQERRRVRTRSAAVALACVAAVAVGAALAIDARRQQAERAEAVTREALGRARVLALEAASFAEQRRDATLAMLLAMEAVQAAGGTPQDSSVQRLRESMAACREVAVLRPHQGAIHSVAWSPDGTRLLTASADATVRVLDRDGGELAVLRGHARGVNEATWSPRGDRIITCGADWTVRVWSPEGVQQLELRVPDGFATRAEIDPSGRVLMASCVNQVVRTYDAATGEPLGVITGHGSWVGAARFSPDGQRIVTASGDRTAAIWDRAGNRLVTLAGHEEGVQDAAWLPSGEQVLTVSDDRTARLWEAATGQCLAVLRGHVEWIIGCEVAPRGDLLLTAGADSTVRVWDARGRLLDVLRGHEAWVMGAAASPDSARIATAGQDGTLRLWTLAGHEPRMLRRHEGWSSCVLAARDGRRIASGGDDGLLRLWDPDGTPRGALAGHQGRLRAIVASPAQDRLLTCAHDATARLWAWHPDGRAEPLAALQGHERDVLSATFAPDGSALLTSSADRTVRLWDADGRPGPVLRAHRDVVRAAAFWPGADLVLTGCDSGEARLWRRDGTEVARLVGHRGAVRTAAADPGGRFALTGSGDGLVRVWDREGRLLRTLEGHGRELNTLCLSRDASRLLSASGDRTARLWDLERGTCLATFGGHLDGVTVACFSPDERNVLTVARDGSARLWALDGTQRALLSQGDGLGHDACFLPDGRSVLCTAVDGSLQAWTLDPQLLLERARQLAPRTLSPAERERWRELLEPVR